MENINSAGLFTALPDWISGADRRCPLIIVHYLPSCLHHLIFDIPRQKYIYFPYWICVLYNIYIYWINNIFIASAFFARLRHLKLISAKNAWFLFNINYVLCISNFPPKLLHYLPSCITWHLLYYKDFPHSNKDQEIESNLVI